VTLLTPADLADLTGYTLPAKQKAWLSARTIWPTPTVHGNYNKQGLSAKSGDGLATAVLKCATPTARDWRSGDIHLVPRPDGQYAIPPPSP
jgi:hypothetical protein